MSRLRAAARSDGDAYGYTPANEHVCCDCHAASGNSDTHAHAGHTGCHGDAEPNADGNHTHALSHTRNGDGDGDGVPRHVDAATSDGHSGSDADGNAIEERDAGGDDRHTDAVRRDLAGGTYSHVQKRRFAGGDNSCCDRLARLRQRPDLWRLFGRHAHPHIGGAARDVGLDSDCWNKMDERRARQRGAGKVKIESARPTVSALKLILRHVESDRYHIIKNAALSCRRRFRRAESAGKGDLER
jgi:hypothetical protein